MTATTWEDFTLFAGKKPSHVAIYIFQQLLSGLICYPSLAWLMQLVHKNDKCNPGIQIRPRRIWPNCGYRRQSLVDAKGPLTNEVCHSFSALSSDEPTILSANKSVILSHFQQRRLLTRNISDGRPSKAPKSRTGSCSRNQAGIFRRLCLLRRYPRRSSARTSSQKAPHSTDQQRPMPRPSTLWEYSQ